MFIQTSKTKFNYSRDNLSNSLKRLEKVVTDKLEMNFAHSSSINSQNNFEETEMKIYQQKLQINNLTKQILEYQKNFDEVSKENELLRSRINGINEVKKKFTDQSNNIIQNINSKLKQIDEIIIKL